MGGLEGDLGDAFGGASGGTGKSAGLNEQALESLAQI